MVLIGAIFLLILYVGGTLAIAYAIIRWALNVLDKLDRIIELLKKK